MKNKVINLSVSYLYIFIFGYIVVSGSLYEWSGLLAAYTGIDSNTLFLLFGILGFCVGAILAVCTVVPFAKAVFPSRHSSSSVLQHKYTTYEEAKRNCKMLCMQCDKHCCPLVCKDSNSNA